MSVEECRKELEEIGDTMTDDQITQLRNAVYVLVEKVFEDYIA